MKKILILVYLTVLGFQTYSQLLLNENIHVDQFGYTPEMTKVAVLANPQFGFNSSSNYDPSPEIHVVNALTNEVVFSASPLPWANGETHNQSGDKGWWFDFSPVTEEGTYFVRDNTGGQSYNFEIKENVYQDVMSAASRMFFYNRCNAEKPEQFAGVIDELKWELDWLLKMTDSNGAVHIKMGSTSYDENIASPPSLNTDQRFYGPTCTSASLAAAAEL